MEFINLLVIEDDFIDQRTIRRALSESFLFVRPEFASSLKEAEEIIGKEWDLILTDYNLPLYSGLDILEFLKERKPKVPIIVMTGVGTVEIANEAMDAGAFDFLTKNLITPEGIGLAIRNAIKVYNEQRKAEELLKTIQEREKQLIETQKIAGLGSWEYDLNTNKFVWTDQTFNIFGRDTKEDPWHYSEFLDSVIDEDRDILIEAIDKAIAQKIPYEIITRHLKEDSKSLIYVSGRGAPYIKGDEVVKLYGTVMDVTKEKEFEAELIKSRLGAENLARIKQDFLANMSHEIRTPMNAILGFTDIVLKESLNDSVHKNVSRIKQAGNNLLVIINDILDFSKIEAGQLEIEKVKFNLSNCLDYVYSQLEDVAKKKNLRLFFNIDSDTPKIVEGDSVRLTQILTNLINNGLKFTEKGFVEVRVKLHEETSEKVSILFEVEDTGIGIQKSMQSKMFESFTQATSDTTRRYGGTGLGLAICKSLVEFQNGKIWIESEEGVGSVFKFTIEFGVCAQVLEKKEKEIAVIEETNIEGVKLLLVEDNQMNRELAIHFLKQWGVKYEVAENGRVGVDKVISGDFDVVLMDISMPVLDGYSATKEIRSLASNKSAIPVIAITANAFSNDIEKCFDIGMNDHVSKPFKAPELKEKIHSLVKHGKALGIESNYRHNKAIKNSKNVSDEVIVSLDILEEMGGGNEEFITNMLTLYINETPITINKIENALLNGDMKALKEAIHKYRSPAGLLGITEAVKLAEFVELNVFEESKTEEVKIAVPKLLELAKKSVNQAKEFKL